MQSKSATIEQYLAELPEDRRTAIAAVRKVILKNLGKGFEEGMQYGMIGYFVPHRLYPAGYHCDPKQPLPFVCLASQKKYMSLYMMCQYCADGESTWFRTEWAKTGKKLDMGKSCIRFKKVKDLAVEVIAEALLRTPVEKHIEFYESAIKDSRKRSAAKGKPAGKATKKKATK